MGARDLYIAEVYDVAGTGATQKPYGRVFYTKGKSLIFYAYDLNQEAGVQNASTFQSIDPYLLESLIDTEVRSIPINYRTLFVSYARAIDKEKV